VLALSLLTPLAAAQSITFEEFAGSGNPEFGAIATGGYELVSEHAHVMNDFKLPIATVAENGSLAYVSSEGGSFGAPIMLRRAHGEPFGLPYFDAAELWALAPEGFPNATSIELTLTNADGSVHTEVYALDGIVDGAGGSPDFQTIVRPASYALLSVVIAGEGAGSGNYAFAIDDIAVRQVWQSVGPGTAGSAGVPSLTAMGTLAAGGAGELHLQSAPPSAAGLLLASIDPSALPFKGGTLYAAPIAAALPFVTDPAGSLMLAWQHAPGVPGVPQLVLQAALVDAGAVGGVALSGAIAADLIGLVPGSDLIVAAPALPGDPLAAPPGP
jgi:hypothetical protein